MEMVSHICLTFRKMLQAKKKNPLSNQTAFCWSTWKSHNLYFAHRQIWWTLV